MKKSSIIYFVVVFLFINVIGIYVAGGFYETTVKGKAFTNFCAIFSAILIVIGNENNFKG